VAIIQKDRRPIKVAAVGNNLLDPPPRGEIALRNKAFSRPLFV